MGTLLLPLFMLLLLLPAVRYYAFCKVALKANKMRRRRNRKVLHGSSPSPIIHKAPVARSSTSKPLITKPKPAKPAKPSSQPLMSADGEDFAISPQTLYRKRRAHVVLMTGAIMHMRLTGLSLQTILCRPLPDPFDEADAPALELRLISDPTVLCYSSSHWRLAGLGWLVLFLCAVAYPVGSCYYLHKQFRALPKRSQNARSLIASAEKETAVGRGGSTETWLFKKSKEADKLHRKHMKRLFNNDRAPDTAAEREVAMYRSVTIQCLVNFIFLPHEHSTFTAPAPRLCYT